MITVRDLSYSYPKSQTILEHIDLQFEPGKIYGLLGRNGMGKSTLLKLIGGYLFPRSGSVTLDGDTPQERRPKLLERIFFLSEEFELPSLSIKQYVAVYSPFYTRFDHEQFDNILSDFGLTHDAKVNKLSYGQKKKFLISFGLATMSSYLILDEPTNGLDIPSKGDFRRIVAKYLTDNQVVIISTHQIDDLENLLDVITIIDEGQIVLSKSIIDIEGSVLFSTDTTISGEDDVVYHERIPGGYLTLRPNVGSQPTQINIAAFFNAVINNKSYFKELFKS